MTFKDFFSECEDVNSLTGRIKSYTFDDELLEAFDIYFFIQTINDSTGSYTKDIKNLKNLKGIQYKIYSFFEKHSAHIELLFQKDLQRVYFAIHPSCRFLIKRVRNELMDIVVRDTANDKLTTFMAQCPMLFDTMDHLSS